MPLRRAWTFTAAVAAGGASLAMVAAHIAAPATPVRIPLLLLAAAFFACECRAVHIHFRGEAHSLSLTEVPVVLGLFFAGTDTLLLATAIGVVCALKLVRRQATVKLVFNVAQFLLSTSVTVIVFRAIAGGRPDPLEPAVWGAVLAGTCAGSALAIALIATVVSLVENGLDVTKVLRSFRAGLIVTVTNSALAILGVALVWRAPAAGLLVVVPAATLFFGYRAYWTERQRRESLDFLHGTTQMIDDAPGIEAALVGLLNAACTMFRAERAEIIVFPFADGESARRTAVGPDSDDVVMADVDIADPSCEWARNAHHSLQADAIVAPLRGDSRTFGAFRVCDRRGQVDTFTAEDRKLFETLAAHASVSLENGRLEKTLNRLTELEERLKYMAFHDPLTDLANRTLFTDRVRQALLRVRRQSRPMAVLFVDVDDFKLINDSLGHGAGDQLLVSVADRLARCLRPPDTACRLGGDEFAILLEDMRSGRDAVIVAERIMAALREPILLQDREVFVHISIGIATSDSGADDVEEFLRNADLAMYMAKADGKDRYRFFEPGMHAATIERLELKGEIERALVRDEFVVYYQPTIELRTGQVAGMEALVRWRHPTRGLVPPASFIPLAEETGQVVPIGRWVLDEVTRQAREWQGRFPSDPPLTMSVNISARQLQDAGFVADVRRALARTGLRPDSLILEITESVLVHESAIEQLRNLKELGVRIAIDDFGTGYSSLSYLSRLPIDVLKMDRSFVCAMSRTPQEGALARAIIQLGQTLGVQTVAEGIEGAVQLAQLRQLDCDFGQGFFLSEPLDGDTMEACLVAARHSGVVMRLSSVVGA
jgi:diguanylate cyclase (GGDEF)-like protein